MISLIAVAALMAQIPAEPLHLKSPVRDKNFYFFRLIEEDPARFATDVELSRVAAAKRAAAVNAVARCKMDVPCHTAAFRWTEAEIESVGKTLSMLPPPAGMRASGAFIRYAQGPDAELMAKAWKDAALAMNRIFDVYAEGKPPRSAAIDGISHETNGQRLGMRVDFATAMIADAPAPKFFFDTPLRFAMQMLELNWRDEAGRHEPMALTENKAAVAAVSKTDWKLFAYQAIVVPGAGGDRLTVPMDPAARWRAQLAAERYHAGLAPFIVVSGGYVHPMQTPFNEAIEMRRVLVRDFGVPENAVFIDPHARHTTTNLRNAARILFRAGVDLAKPVLITTDQYQSAYIEAEVFSKRCDMELGYRPYRIVKRTGRFDLAAMLLMVSLQMDAIDPLDP